ncbi:hypothetical protein OHB93_14510 [Microbacterium sp. No. 7]|uniref:hypothetical protein n=1 Tax=Microbacterium sp. No. 7 TaxID=1714373 RepID=UPI00300AA4AA
MRDAQQRADRARSVLSQTLLQAKAQVSAAEDFISARRGAVGATARTRLAEAGAALVQATQLQQSDPERALDLAHRAAALAGEAMQRAQGDVGSFAGGGNTGGGGDFGGMLGGIILGSLLAAADRDAPPVDSAAASAVRRRGAVADSAVAGSAAARSDAAAADPARDEAEADSDLPAPHLTDLDSTTSRIERKPWQSSPSSAASPPS